MHAQPIPPVVWCPWHGVISLASAMHNPQCRDCTTAVEDYRRNSHLAQHLKRKRKQYKR